MTRVTAVDYSTSIPNNVDLGADRRVLKSLEQWHCCRFIDAGIFRRDGFRAPFRIQSQITISRRIFAQRTAQFDG